MQTVVVTAVVVVVVVVAAVLQALAKWSESERRYNGDELIDDRRKNLSEKTRNLQSRCDDCVPSSDWSLLFSYSIVRNTYILTAYRRTCLKHVYNS